MSKVHDDDMVLSLTLGVALSVPMVIDRAALLACWLVVAVFGG